MDIRTVIIVVLLMMLLGSFGALGMIYYQQSLTTPDIPIPDALRQPRETPDAPVIDNILQDMRLFFLSRDHGKLTTHIIHANAPSSVSGRVQMALEELLKGPPPLVSREMLGAIPAGTVLQSVWWNDREGRIYASFSEDLILGYRAHALAEWATIYSIVNTVAAQSPAIREVQLLVDGQIIDSAYTVWDWSLPFEPDQVFVDISSF